MKFDITNVRYLDSLMMFDPVIIWPKFMQETYNSRPHISLVDTAMYGVSNVNTKYGVF